MHVTLNLDHRAFLAGAAATLGAVETLSGRVHALGWHCQFHMLGDQITDAAAMFERLPSRIVFDHLGRIP